MKMRRMVITMLAVLSALAATAGTFPLTDGTSIVGTPDSIVDRGVVFQLPDGSLSARIEWDKFTPEAIKELASEAKTENERALLEPMVDNLPQEVAKRKEIVIKPIEIPVRPAHGVGIFGLFGSSVGWMMLVALYAANLFAAYEVCIYRRRPPGMVCGLAAIPFFGVLSPIVFGCMPTLPPPAEPTEAEPTEEAPIQMATPGAAGLAEMAETGKPEPKGAAAAETGPAAATGPKLPEPVIFQRGEFAFNRRFFETKFAGFFRVIPTEAEKDLVLRIRAARGEFTGRRISRITPNELYLQVTVNNVSSEEMIPFMEIAEVQIRHKDSQ
jgi:hypothetical protein